MAGESALVLSLAMTVCGMVAASTGCLQTSAVHFMSDDKNCSTFYVCVMGQRSAMSCPAEHVFDNQTVSCVAAYSFNDKCSPQRARLARCPPGSKQPVPHPTKCAQYYDCGATVTLWMQRDAQLRECPPPLVFSPVTKTCVLSAPGVCGAREEPLDVCDYEVNQCDGHADCVPCEVRFPSCRGLDDGINTWRGRRRSPYYVICRHQRVIRSGMCKQEGTTVTFDPEKRACVDQKGEVVEKIVDDESPLQLLPTTSMSMLQMQQQQGVYQLNAFQTYIPLGLGYQVPTNLNRLL